MRGPKFFAAIFGVAVAVLVLVLQIHGQAATSRLACYGRQDHRTPHLDRLASQGTRFATAYVAQPICSPSRAAILTARAPARLHLTTFLPRRPDCPSQKLL